MGVADGAMNLSKNTVGFNFARGGSIQAGEVAHQPFRLSVYLINNDWDLPIATRIVTF
jgi:hypothetical protein